MLFFVALCVCDTVEKYVLILVAYGTYALKTQNIYVKRQNKVTHISHDLAAHTCPDGYYHVNGSKIGHINYLLSLSKQTWNN